MADISPVMIWVTNADGEVVFINHATLQFFGIEDAVAERDFWQTVLHPEDKEQYIDCYREAARYRRRFRAQARFRRSDGAYRWIASYGAPYFSDAGDFLGFVGSSPDVTEQVELAQRLQQSDRRKDELMALLAHELRNPLTTVRNALAVIKRSGPLRTEQQRCMDAVERECGRIAGLVDDLTDLELIAMGKFRVRMHALEIRSLVRNVMDTTRPTLASRRQRLVAAMPASDMFVKADELRLSQVLGNLLLNASKFSPPSTSIRLTVRGTAREVRISIQDKGVGIAPVELDRIFEMFAQVRRRPLHGDAGMGLGLALARDLVHLHRGTIEARSEGTGKGSEFLVRLPRLSH